MLTIHDVTRAFGNTPVLNGISLEIAQGEILCLLGPSGCGKTTLLRIIAGLEQADRGDVLLDGHTIAAVPVHQRGFGLMFQDFALFPHMDVAGNIAFGLRMQRLSRAAQDSRVQEVLNIVNLSGFENRDVALLSGGERQRVALARSLAPNPRLLMLDEPLGSLDAALREQLVVELHHIIKRLGLTAIYVTHDQHEAFAIADRIALMNAGRIQQIGTPQSVYRQPETTFAARFLGLHNVLSIIHQDGDTAETALGAFRLPQPAQAVLIHPDLIELTESPAAQVVTGQIEESVFMGAVYRVRLRHASGARLTLNVPPTAAHTIGESLTVHIPPAAALPLRE